VFKGSSSEINCIWCIGGRRLCKVMTQCVIWRLLLLFSTYKDHVCSDLVCVFEYSHLIWRWLLRMCQFWESVIYILL
jgi:hypothetical protein